MFKNYFSYFISLVKDLKYRCEKILYTLSDAFIILKL